MAVAEYFNTATAPSQYLALDFGGIRYKGTEKKSKNYEGMRAWMCR